VSRSWQELRSTLLTLCSLLALDALYDPPRLLVPEATLDVPSATTTSDAEPQQGASTAFTTPAPTAASDMLPSSDQEQPDSYPAATEQLSHHDAEDPTLGTTAIDSQTPDFSADMQSDHSTSTAGSPATYYADTFTLDTAAIKPQTPDFSADAQSEASPNTADSPMANGAKASTSHTAMLESQTPEVVYGSQSNAPSTAASGSSSNGASTDVLSDGASPPSTGTSVGARFVFTVKTHAAVGLSLLFSFTAW